MTTRISLLPYGPSDSCTALRDAIYQAIQTENLDATITLLRSTGSTFRGTAGRILINYGNRRYPQTFFGQATVLNNLDSLNRAANKLQALNTLSQAGIPTVEYTTLLTQAQTWVNEGSTVYARGTLTGHSGEGITVVEGNNTLPPAPLYTKGITTQRREWRIHVFKGVITYVQLKKRRDGWREDSNYSETVRNHHTGWIYSTAPNNVAPSDAVLRAAYDSVQALGLDFGAVDVISRQDQAWVLEVNTAPGLTGTTLDTYKHNFIEFVKSVSTRHTPSYRVAYPVPAPRPQVVNEVEVPAEASPTPVPPAPAPAPSRSTTASMPETQAETNPGVTLDSALSAANLRDLPRGLYLASLEPANGVGGIVVDNVVLYISNGYAFRHGWNLPVNPRFIVARTLHKIESLVANGTTVTL